MEWLLNIQQAVKSMWDVVGRRLNRRSFCALVFFHFWYGFVVFFHFFHYLFFCWLFPLLVPGFFVFLSSFALICDFTSIFMLLLFLFIIVSCYLFSFHSSVPRLQLFIIMLSHSLSYVYIFIIFFTLYLNNNTILLLPLCWLYLSSFPPSLLWSFFFLHFPSTLSPLLSWHAHWDVWPPL